MNKKLCILLVSFLTISLGICLIDCPDVNAVSYYNWILGSEMETTTNYVEDCGFESGIFNSGVLYGNWSNGYAFSSTISHTGVYSLEVHGGLNDTWYNFTNSILGADINKFTYYLYDPDSYTYNYFVRVYYSDYSYSEIEEPQGTVTATWEFFDHTAMIDDAKYVVALNFEYDPTFEFYIDDIFLGVPDDYSQEQYSFDSYPWRTTGLLGYWQSIGYTDFPTLLPFLNYRVYPTGAYVDVNYIGHNLIWGRNSNGSGYIGYDESTAQFVQDINYLDSDSVHYINLWAYTLYATSVGVKINIIYSDRSFDTKTVNITTVSTWENLNFGGSWIDDNKYIVQIQIQLANYIPAYVNIDDVGIWSSLPANRYRFTYTVSPSPITQTPISFNVFMGQSYTFTGYLWDSEGELSENGTVAVSHNYGVTTATLSNGIFSFVISPRTGSTNGFAEQFGISVNTGETVELYELTVNWVYSSSVIDDDDAERATNLTDWIVMFIVIFIPATIFASSLYENNQQPDAMHINPVFGIISGLCLSIGIGVYTALVPLWLIVVMIASIVVIIVGMVKK